MLAITSLIFGLVFQDGFEQPVPDCFALPGAAKQSRATFVRNGTPGFALTYQDAFGPFPHAPGNAGATYVFNVIRTQYIALPFTVPDLPPVENFAQIDWVFFDNQPAFWTVSISTCEGGVTTPVPQQGTGFCGITQPGGSGGRLTYGTLEGVNCLLEVGASYFLNVSAFDPVTESDTCGDNSCDWRMQIR